MATRLKLLRQQSASAGLVLTAVGLDDKFQLRQNLTGGKLFNVANAFQLIQKIFVQPFRRGRVSDAAFVIRQ